MLTFLIATSVLNVMAGYALAVYVRGASAASVSLSASGRLAKPSLTKPERRSNVAGKTSPQAAADKAPSGGETKPIASEQAASAPADAGATFKSTVEATMNRPIEEMEHQLMAGIADFRNQLAKLRAESFTVGSQDAVA